MRFPKRFSALLALLAGGVVLAAAPQSGERGKDRVESTSVFVELMPPKDRDEIWGKEIILCWDTAVDKGSRFGFAANGGFTPPDLSTEGYRETFQVPGLAVEIDKRRTEKLSHKMAKEGVTLVVFRLTYHRKLQTGSWAFGVHSIPPKTWGLRLPGKVRLLIEKDSAAPPDGKNARSRERSR